MPYDRRIPDPTTAGDFCRRLTVASIQTLQEVIHDARLNARAKQPIVHIEAPQQPGAGALVDRNSCWSIPSAIGQRWRRLALPA